MITSWQDGRESGDNPDSLAIGDDITITKATCDMWIAKIGDKNKNLNLNFDKSKLNKNYYEDGQFRREHSLNMCTESFSLDKDELVWQIVTTTPDQHLKGVNVSRIFLCKAIRRRRSCFSSVNQVMSMYTVTILILAIIVNILMDLSHNTILRPINIFLLVMNSFELDTSILQWLISGILLFNVFSLF